MLVISELCRYQHVFVHTHPPLLCAMSKEEYSCQIQIGTKVATMASSFQGLGCSMPGVCDSHSFPITPVCCESCDVGRWPLLATAVGQSGPGDLVTSELTLNNPLISALII